MMHPASDHVIAHQPFRDDSRIAQIETAEQRLKALFEELTPDERKRLHVRASYYLPRFAARVFDEETMLVKFYLYKSRAQGNPVIELHHERNEAEFACILQSLNTKFERGVETKVDEMRNRKVIHNGKWYGLFDQEEA